MKNLIAILIVLFGFMTGTAVVYSNPPPKNHIWHHGELLDCTKPRPDPTEFPDPCKDSKDFTDHEWAAWTRSNKGDIILKCMENGVEKWDHLTIFYLEEERKRMYPHSKKLTKKILKEILKRDLSRGCKVID